MRSVALLLRVLAGCLLVAPVQLAIAAPADPLWIHGIYDDADHDDVVWLLADDGLALRCGQPPAGEAAPRWSHVIPGPSVSAQRVSAHTSRPRGPPAFLPFS